jgi:hypothetical protein
VEEQGLKSDMATKLRTFQQNIASIACSKIVYDDGVLTIQGSDRNGTCVAQITFDSALLVRIADESMRLRFFQQLGESRPDLIMIDEESDLIQWVKEEGINTRDLSEAKHFVVVAGEEITDVVSVSPPTTSLTDVR